MVGLWLVGQGPGVMPGGVAVVYAPPGGSADPAEERPPCPWSTETLRIARTPAGTAGVRAGLALVGELEYGPDGLDRFAPRLWTAVQMPLPHPGTGADPSGGADAGVGGLGSIIHRGPSTIGLSDKLQFIDRYDLDGVLGRTRVVGWAERPDGVVQTCEDTPVAGFPVLFGNLTDYLRFQVAAQVAGNGYDDLAGTLARSDRPSHAIIIAGLAPARPEAAVGVGGVCHSIAYDPRVISTERVSDALHSAEPERLLEAEGVSWLRQERAG